MNDQFVGFSMYSSRECQSKCIRNTVSSLLVLARDLRTSATVCVWQQKEYGSFHQLARSKRCQAGLLPNAVAPPVAGSLTWITSSAKSSPLSSIAPEAHVECFDTPERRAWWAMCSLGVGEEAEDTESEGGRRLLARTVGAVDISCAVSISSVTATLGTERVMGTATAIPSLWVIK